MQNNQTVIWVCPFCKEEFEWFEVLDTPEHIDKSLAPHLWTQHEPQLTERRNG